MKVVLIMYLDSELKFHMDVVRSVIFLWSNIREINSDVAE